jgi:hypothetical protein
VTSSSILDARVALRLANSSWVVIRPRFRRGAGIGMGAASGVATWEGIVVDMVGGVVVWLKGWAGSTPVGENKVDNEAGYLWER